MRKKYDSIGLLVFELLFLLHMCTEGGTGAPSSQLYFFHRLLSLWERQLVPGKGIS